MAGGREHLESAVSLRALARQTDLPSARRALLDLAKRFDRMAARYGAETSVPDWHHRLECSESGGRNVDMVVSVT
jgi:hypothetical protein